MRKNMKKIGVLLGICVCGLGITACGSSKETVEETQNTEIETVIESVEEEYYIPSLKIVERTETGKVDTPFGTAVIYSFKLESEPDGNQFDTQSVLLTVGESHITMENSSGMVNFEELLPQMFVLE